MRNNNRTIKGFTLIEMLVAITVFSFLAVISTQILALSLRGVTKSQNIAETRENIDNAVLTIDRLLRSARSCENASPFTYQDQAGQVVELRCLTDGNGIGYIASDSARLTSTQVDIDCGSTTIQCIINPGRPDIVEITVAGEDSSHTGIEGAEYSSSTRTVIRNYSSD